MSRPVARLRALLVRLGFALGRLRPVGRRVVLATTHADRLSGNLGELRDGLAARRPDVPMRVLARRTTGGLGQARAAVDAVVAGWHLATARVFVVDDHYFPMYAIPPRAGTTFIQVWHACGAFKKFGYSVVEKRFGADAATVDAVPIHSNYDVCLVSAMRFAPFYAEAFRQPLDRFTARIGIPRTDLFFDEARRARIAADLRTRYAIPADRRVILHAPTFRGERTTSARTPVDLDLELLRARLGTDHVVLLRAHPSVATAGALPAELRDFVIDVSGHPEINELMLVSDVLVTDYSSAIYEFALLERPIVFFAPDHADYERERGFYLDFRTGMPGPIFETTDALATYLRAGSFDLEAVRRFRDESFDVADGGATRRLIDELVVPALG